MFTKASPLMTRENDAVSSVDVLANANSTLLCEDALHGVSKGRAGIPNNGLSASSINKARLVVWLVH